MLAIFKRILIDRKYSLIVYLVVGVGMLWMYVAMFPAIQTQGEFVVDILEQFPEKIQKVLEGLGADAASLTTIEGFLATKQYSLVWPILAVLMIAGLAGATIAGEIEKGSLEITLARPVSRTNLLLGRYFAGVILILAFTFVSIFSVVPMAGFYDVDINISNVVKLSILAFLFGWAVLSLSMFFSSIFSERSRTFATIGGIIMGMYVLNTVALISEKYENVRYISFFHYFDTVGALINNTIGGTSIVVFIIVIIVFTGLGIFFFNKRDIVI